MTQHTTIETTTSQSVAQRLSFCWAFVYAAKRIADSGIDAEGFSEEAISSLLDSAISEIGAISEHLAMN